MIHSTQPNVQTAKNIEVTSSTTKREIIEVRDTETGWDTRHLPALSREAEHNCYGRKTNNEKAGNRDEHSDTQRIRYLTQPTISRTSSISRERLLFNTHSKPIKCDFEFRFCQKCYKPPQNIQSGFSRQEKTE